MAGGQDDQERTEDPTQKRLDEALQRGDVVKSQEVSTWFIIAGATLVLMTFSGAMSAGLTVSMRGLIANSYAVKMDGRDLLSLMDKLGIEVIAAIAIPLLPSTPAKSRTCRAILSSNPPIQPSRAAT